MRQATEMGVQRIIPFFSERSERPAPERARRRQERWQRLAREILKSCQRSVLPEIGPVQEFAADLIGFRGDEAHLLGRGAARGAAILAQSERGPGPCASSSAPKAAFPRLKQPRPGRRASGWPVWVPGASRWRPRPWPPLPWYRAPGGTWPDERRAAISGSKHPSAGASGYGCKSSPWTRALPAPTGMAGWPPGVASTATPGAPAPAPGPGG